MKFYGILQVIWRITLSMRAGNIVTNVTLLNPLTNCICSKGRSFVPMVCLTICFLLCDVNSLTTATLYSASLFAKFSQ